MSGSWFSSKGSHACVTLIASVSIFVLLWMVEERGSHVKSDLSPVVFHLGVVCATLTVIFAVSGLFTISPDKVWLLFFSTWFCIAGLEIALRVSGTMELYTETRRGMYYSAYEHHQPDEQRRWTSNDIHLLTTPEYNFDRRTNSFGFSDDEFLAEKTGQTVIQTYGDSYTEGDGAPTDSTYPALLRNLFSDSTYVVQNFGVCGSDPAFSYRQLLRTGLSLSPDIVVIAYNSGDYLADFFVRGGLDRFHDGGWSARNAPWWEFIYAYSHVFRGLSNVLFDIVPNGLLISEQRAAERNIQIRNEWIEVFDSIAALSAAHNFELVLIRHPMLFELEQGHYAVDFDFFDQHLSSKQSSVTNSDLMEYYVDSSGLGNHQFEVLYWPVDGHHNSKGYLQMAKAVHVALPRDIPE